MSFGEHLEELRKSLFRAVIWLVAGVLLGLGVADRVVSYIQTPLRAALTRYFQQDAERLADQKIQELRDRGEQFTDEEYVRARIKQGLLPETILIDRDQLLKVLKLQRRQASRLQTPPADGTSTRSPRPNWFPFPFIRRSTIHGFRRAA